MELTFSAEAQIFGRQEIVDLIPGGRHIAVTDENKSEYVSLVAKHRMTNSIKAQIDSFLDGFYDLVPPELITIFSPTELELLICGLPDVDIDDLRNNTDYHNFQPADQAIGYFWEALQSFSREERALFLQFVTGTSKVSICQGLQSLPAHRTTLPNSFFSSCHSSIHSFAHRCPSRDSQVCRACEVPSGSVSTEHSIQPFYQLRTRVSTSWICQPTLVLRSFEKSC